MSISQEQLIRIATGDPEKGMRRATLISWLRKNGIKFMYTANEKKVWTTQTQIDRAFDGKQEALRLGQKT